MILFKNCSVLPELMDRFSEARLIKVNGVNRMLH